MSNVAEQVHHNVTRWVSFYLHGETYGIDVMQVRQVLCAGEITRVPGAPGFVAGVINLCGDIVTVVDARLCSGFSHKQPDDDSRLIVAELGDETICLLVDGVGELVELDTADIDAVPGAGNACLNSVRQSGHGPINLFDPEVMLARAAATESACHHYRGTAELAVGGVNKTAVSSGI